MRCANRGFEANGAVTELRFTDTDALDFRVEPTVDLKASGIERVVSGDRRNCVTTDVRRSAGGNSDAFAASAGFARPRGSPPRHTFPL